MTNKPLQIRYAAYVLRVDGRLVLTIRVLQEEHYTAEVERLTSTLSEAEAALCEAQADRSAAAHDDADRVAQLRYDQVAARRTGVLAELAANTIDNRLLPVLKPRCQRPHAMQKRPNGPSQAWTIKLRESTCRCNISKLKRRTEKLKRKQWQHNCCIFKVNKMKRPTSWETRNSPSLNNRNAAQPLPPHARRPHGLLPPLKLDFAKRTGEFLI